MPPHAVPILYIDTHLVHEVTSPQAFDKAQQPKGTSLRSDATMDHNVPTTDRSLPVTVDCRQMETLAQNCTEFDIPLYDIES